MTGVQTCVFRSVSQSRYEKKWSKDRKGWKHKDLAEVVAERIQESAIDLDTGERVLSVQEMIGRTWRLW